MTSNDARTGRARSVIISGFAPTIITVEARWDAESKLASRDDLRETKDRVRAAVRNSGITLPPLALTLATEGAPASTVDLAWACATYAATIDMQDDSIEATTLRERLEHMVLFGELRLDGSLAESFEDLEPAVAAAQRDGALWVVVPEVCLGDIPFMTGIQVFGAKRLRDVIAWMRGEPNELIERTPTPEVTSWYSPAAAEAVSSPELASALVVAAGGHHMWPVCLPGTSAVPLARAVHNLLPPLSEEQAAEVERLHSSSPLGRSRSIDRTEPPFIWPDSSLDLPTFLSIVDKDLVPGVLSLAHHGGLFIEDGSRCNMAQLSFILHSLNRGGYQVGNRDGYVTAPALFQLVFATPPCPCDKPDATCVFTAECKRNFLPMMPLGLQDHLDVRVVLAPTVGDEHAAHATFAVTKAMCERVQVARKVARTRWSSTNARVPLKVLRQLEVPRDAQVRLAQLVNSGALNLVAEEHVLRVAQTIADLNGRAQLTAADITTAVTLRNGEPVGLDNI